MMNGAKIIAEIGINHNGKYEEAKSLIESSYKSGCYGIKFQYRNIKRSYVNNQANEIGDDLLKSEISRCYLNALQQKLILHDDNDIPLEFL